MLNIGSWSYISLLIIGIILLVISYWKAKSKRVFLLFFADVGFILLFDYIIYVWGHAYQYYPHLIHGQYDSKLGGYINAFIIASAATLYAVFQAGIIRGAGLALFFIMIEILFMWLGIYEQYWWKTGYTLILLFIHFQIIKIWWNALKPMSRGFLPFITLASCFFAIRASLAGVQYGILEIRTYQVEWLQRIGQESIALNAMIVLPFSVFFAYCIHYRRNIWILVGIVISLIIDFGCKVQGYIMAEVPWDWLYYLAADCLSVWAAIYLGKTLYQEKRLPLNR